MSDGYYMDVFSEDELAEQRNESVLEEEFDDHYITRVSDYLLISEMVRRGIKLITPNMAHLVKH